MKVTIGNATVYIGDALTCLQSMESESVQCCVTSPPYWGLRDYGTAQWEGGDINCNHLQGPLASKKSTLSGYTSDNIKLAIGGMPYKEMCGKCGAKRIDNQIGLERTPEDYIEKLVQVFREVRRVLRKDGTLWIVIGDSYAGSTMTGGDKSVSTLAGTHHRQRTDTDTLKEYKRSLSGLKPKDLCGIPWRVALALQADGWWLRSDTIEEQVWICPCCGKEMVLIRQDCDRDIIWKKPNPMPESVTDRPTKSHEYIFLLSKSEKYFYDADAIKEDSHESSGWARQRRQGINTWEYNNTLERQTQTGQIANSNKFGEIGKRNKRSVWTIPTLPYPGSHFAVFPPALIEPCILAGSRPGDTILDPFFGSGTTGEVALKYGRKVIGIELNSDYRVLWEKRVKAAQRQLRLYG